VKRSKECWTLTEITDLLELLLGDRCEVVIKTLPKHGGRTDTTWLVEWQPDKQLCDVNPW